MLRLQKGRLMLCRKPSKVVQFMSWKSPVFCQWHWVKPKLGDSALSFHMDVRRLTFIRTENDETIWAILKYGRHSILPASSLYFNNQKNPFCDNHLPLH
jgi:hypothetical protein